MKLMWMFVITLMAAVTESAVLSGKGKERIMHDGPKVLIKSTALQHQPQHHQAISSRQKNSDLHEIYLAPYRYVSRIYLQHYLFIFNAHDDLIWWKTAQTCHWHCFAYIIHLGMYSQRYLPSRSTSCKRVTSRHTWFFVSYFYYFFFF